MGEDGRYSSKDRFGNAVSSRQQHAYYLHEAAKKRNVDEIHELLESSGYDILQLIDNYGNTPLHSLLSEVCSGEDCKSKARECVKLLLRYDAGTQINIANAEGNVPLFLAIKNEWEECAMILLHHGADTTIKLQNGKLLAKYLMDEMPNVLGSILDFAVEREYTKDEDILIIDFSRLLQYPKQYSAADPMSGYKNDETEFIHSLLQISKHTNLYEHPVTELFMRLKYRKLRSVIVFSIFLHMLTLGFYTSYIIYQYISVCEYHEDRKLNLCGDNDEENGAITTAVPKCVERCKEDNIARYMSLVLGIIWIAWIIIEVVILWYRGIMSIFTKSNFIWLLFYILMPLSLWPSVEDKYYINTWRYPVAASGVWLVWALCVQQLNKVPHLAVYLKMFIRVSIKIVLLALLFFPLLVGFTVGFYVMGAQNIEEVYSFVTVISEMIGEPDYNDFFDREREKSIVYTGVAILMYLLFIILMCVVFVNFLLGLTISDMTELWEEAERASRKDQIRLMYLFDRLKFLRFKIFGVDAIKANNLRYAIEVKNYPSYLPDRLIKQLKDLSVLRDCSHQRVDMLGRRVLNLKPSTSTSIKDKSSQKKKYYNSQFNRGDNENIMDAIKHLENQIAILTKVVLEKEVLTI